jgi:hypothetical protein
MSNEKWPVFEAWKSDNSAWWVRCEGGGVMFNLTEPVARTMAHALNLARESLALAEAAEELQSLESFKLATPEWITVVAKRDAALAAFRAARERQGSKT